MLKETLKLQVGLDNILKMKDIVHKKSRSSEEYNEWIEELMVLYNSLVSQFFIYPSEFFIVIRVLSSLYLLLVENQSDASVLMPFGVAIVLFSSHYLRWCFPKYTTIVTLIFIECFNFGGLVRYSIGQNRNHALYPVVSGFFTFFLQFFLFKINRWVLMFIQMKTLVLWIMLDSNQDSIMKSFNITNFLTIFGMGLFLTLFSYVRDRTLKVVFKYKQSIIKRQVNLNTIVEAMPDGLVVLNSQMKVRLLNNSLRRIFKIEVDSDFIQKFDCLTYMQGRRVYGEGKEFFIHHDVEDYLASGNIHTTTFGITQIDDKYYEWKGNLCKWNNKDSLILVVRDCTTLIELEKSQARQLYQTAVLRAISHELRTPTSAIISANEKLTHDLSRDDKYPEEALTVINVSGQLLLNLINNLLDFVQIDSGTFKIYTSYFSLKDVFEQTINLFALQAKYKKIALRSYIDPKIPITIQNDAERLKQVLINLLTNSMKYTQVGEICLKAILKDNRIKISIKDTGIGMKSIVLSSLFKLFGSQEILGDKSHGCGLKLHISNLLAIHLGESRIKVDSTLNKGSDFSFYLHTGLDHPPQPSEFDSTYENLPIISIPDSMFIKSFKKKYPPILIVDDNEFNRFVISEFLKCENLEFDEAGNGLEAVNAVIRRDDIRSGYKVVIMDCQMPVLDGWEATRKLNKLRTHGRIREIPAIIGYSAYSSREDEIKSKEVGMIEFLLKPTPREQLMKVIKHYL
jgi:signal transduction histidine kinase